MVVNGLPATVTNIIQTLLLCSREERNSFWTALGWVNDISFHFWLNYNFNFSILFFKYSLTIWIQLSTQLFHKGLHKFNENDKWLVILFWSVLKAIWWMCLISKCRAALSDYSNIYYNCDVILITVTYTQSDYAVWKCAAKITHTHIHYTSRPNYVTRIRKKRTHLCFITISFNVMSWENSRHIV